MLKIIADNTNNTSLSHKMRYKRFNYFMSFVKQLDKPISILDVGGTQEYWDKMGLNDPNIKITLLNLSVQPITSQNFNSIAGDATNLKEFNDNSFDVVFSNSVIEHLFTKDNQVKMANEAKRVGRYYFIQTPNYYFPLEPHFLLPGFQFLPFGLKVFLINHFSLGHIPRKQNKQEAINQVKEIKLLTSGEMKKLFPNATLWNESFAGMTKSIVAHNFS